MEILSPVGSSESLVASIKGGCDSVYFGGKSFGARAFSQNFNDQELEGAISYAHDNNVKAYVTVNTLIKNSEMNDAVSFVNYLHDIHADAILIQDLGLLNQIQKCEIKKHASTQMGIHSISGLEWCAEHDIERAVLSRELTFEELEKIVKASPIDTEVFVQGSMCYSLSGGCLFSSVVGGRSGNRGQCAQPCRKKYKLGSKNGYLLSCADIYGVEWLKKLDSIGVKAAKIEGRMRSHAYAYLSTKVYSLVNQDVAPVDYFKENSFLMTVFNRGICEGYFKGNESPVHYKFADNRGYLLGSVRIVNKSFDTRKLFSAVNVKDGISLFKDDEKIGGFKLSNIGNVSVPFGIPDGEYEIYRTYDPRIDEIKNLIGPAPKLTGNKKRIPIKLEFDDYYRTKNKKLELSFYVNSLKNLEIVLNYATRVYFDMNDQFEDAIEMCNAANVDCILNHPRFLPLDTVDSKGCPVMIHSPGQYKPKNDEVLYGSYHYNMFNHSLPNDLHQTTLSVELSKPEISEIAKYYTGRLEIFAFGRTEIMCTRDPNMGNGIIIDEKEYEFPIYKDSYGLSHFLNSSDLLLLPYLKDIQMMGIESIGLDMRKRPSQLVKVVSKAYAERDLKSKTKIIEMCNGVNYGAFLKSIN